MLRFILINRTRKYVNVNIVIKYKLILTRFILLLTKILKYYKISNKFYHFIPMKIG